MEVLVPALGLEPRCPCGRGILSPLRLPFRQAGGDRQSTKELRIQRPECGVRPPPSGGTLLFGRVGADGPQIQGAARAIAVGEGLHLVWWPIAHAELVRDDPGARLELREQPRAQFDVG